MKEARGWHAAIWRDDVAVGERKQHMHSSICTDSLGTYNRSDSGIFLENGAAASASSANAMLSSSIEVPCTVTAGGR